MIHHFVATATAPDLTTREIAHSTVETDRGPAAALKLAVLDLEERGELRGQPGLDVREIRNTTIELLRDLARSTPAAQIWGAALKLAEARGVDAIAAANFACLDGELDARDGAPAQWELDRLAQYQRDIEAD